MAFPNSFLRLILKFNLPGLEVANTTCAWDPSSPLVSLDDATVDAFATRAAAFWTAAKPQYHPNTKYAGCSVAWISPAGLTLARQDRPITPVDGTNGGFPTPNEVAVVMSLRTAVSSRRTRGRMYMPGFATPTMTTEGRWSSTATAALASAGATLLGDLTVGGETFTSVVASATGSLMSSVLTVGVGDVPDAQRRRRDALIESYSNASV